MIFSIDPAGTWSPRQAERVLETIQPEAAALGMMFQVVDVTTNGQPRRVTLLLVCGLHGRAVPEEGACEQCIHEHRHQKLAEAIDSVVIGSNLRLERTQAGYLFGGAIKEFK